MGVDRAFRALDEAREEELLSEGLAEVVKVSGMR